MIARYTRPALGRVWSDENKLAKWLEVELAAAEALAECGQIPKEAAQRLRATARPPAPARVVELEQQVRHDVIAFTMAVVEALPAEAREAGRYLHYGLTSSDILDTALALQLAEANALLRAGLERLAAVLKKRAHEFKDTPMVGRTHGVHAEPTTFGLKLANWYSEIERNRERLARAAEDVRVGKMSGAVGTFAHLAPEIEERICARLGLQPAAISSQVVQRDRLAHYVSTLAVIASSLEKIALEIRHLQRTEVREAEEAFGAAQRGSSAMPHKRNPITAEQICGLARLLRAHAQAALENVALWHERDISHSSVERVILPDATILLDYMLDRTAALIENLRVYPERMKANLELTRGLVFSEALLLALIRQGVAREEAYAWVQEAAMKVWEKNQDFKQLVLADSRITGRLAREEIDAAFDLRHQLRHVDSIFHRVFKS
ncbi:MAG: adenylosuccinate lyase [Acidobacteria bacterium]|nr:adenylosuccinate lyase [Acidobacteriota bacterium]